MDYDTNEDIQDLVDDGWTVAEAMQEVLGHVLPTYSIAPTNQVPIVKDREIDLAAWGFKRVFGGRKQNLINARIEKLTTARTWKRPFLTSRIVIPMSGYYEWVDKHPWYITADESHWVAGLVETKDDHQYFTMVTTEGTDEAGRVHDRMPAFLTNDLRDDWLGGELDESDGQQLVDELEDSAQRIAKQLKTWEVSQRVNSVRVDKTDKSLIEAV